jgi:hypothetical protein
MAVVSASNVVGVGGASASVIRAGILRAGARRRKS